MQRSEIQDRTTPREPPDSAALHPGYPFDSGSAGFVGHASLCPTYKTTKLQTPETPVIQRYNPPSSRHGVSRDPVRTHKPNSNQMPPLDPSQIRSPNAAKRNPESHHAKRTPGFRPLIPATCLIPSRPAYVGHASLCPTYKPTKP
jgi:hypothetical protein